MAFDFDAAVTAPFRMQPGLRRMADAAAAPDPGAGPGRATSARSSPCCRPHRRRRCKPSPASTRDPRCTRSPPMPRASIRRTSAGTASAPSRRRWASRCAAIAVDETSPPAVSAWATNSARCLRGLPDGWRLAGLLSLAFVEDFALVDGQHRHAALAGRGAALALGAAGQDRPPLSRGPRAGRRQRAAAARQRPPDAHGQRARALGALCLERHAAIRACNAHPADVDHAPWPADAFADAPGAARLVAHRTADLHPAARPGAGRVHDPRRDRATGRGDRQRRQGGPACTTPSRR